MSVFFKLWTVFISLTLSDDQTINIKDIFCTAVPPSLLWLEGQGLYSKTNSEYRLSVQTWAFIVSL